MPSFRTIALLTLPLLALSTLSVPARADVKAGVDAWQAGDYRTAVDEWRPLAIAGDADAQFNLGQAYKLGRGVPADLAQAQRPCNCRRCRCMQRILCAAPTVQINRSQGFCRLHPHHPTAIQLHC